MAPLNPTSNKCYTVSYPSDEKDDRLNLKVRTGAATCIINSRIFTFGGLTFGLNLQEMSMQSLNSALSTWLSNADKSASQVNWNDYISNELFELNIVERKWTRRIRSEDNSTDRVAPRPRIFHATVCEEGDLYVSGGLVLNPHSNEFEPIADLWKYDLRSNEWICLCKGDPANKGRFGHSIVYFNSPSAFNKSFHQGILIVGGKSKNDANVPEFDFFDLTEQRWLGAAKKVLPIEDLKISLANKTEKTQKKVVTTNSFESSILVDTTHTGHYGESSQSLIMYTNMGDGSNASPLIEFPSDLESKGKRMPVTVDNFTKNVKVPSNLLYVNAGCFGDHLIVMGFVKNQNKISIFLYHKPSGKWSSLKAFCDHELYSHTITRGFLWSSHHKILLLGNSKALDTSPSVQYFNLFMAISLPFVNVSGTAFYYTGEKVEQFQLNRHHEKSFMEYSRYVAPHVQMTSIKSAFPPYAVTLGRNAFERFGYSVSDIEFVSADGETTPISSMLCRKRWGRCFEMLIAKGYIRAVDNFEKSTIDHEFVVNSDEKSDSTSIRESDDVSSSQDLRDQPHFRLPFQDAVNNAELSKTSSPYLTPTGDTPRKLSVASSSSLLLGPGSPDASKPLIPQQKQQPDGPAPQLSKNKLSLMKTPSASSSPRGSISGGLQPFSILDKPLKESSQKDKKSPHRSSRQGSKGSLAVSKDDTSTVTHPKSLGSISLPSNRPSTKSVAQQLETNSSKMDPLLLPRVMYLPFTTSTVKALLEFLSTGQVGSKWPIVPTTLDIVLISKFYELPLMYDLVVEILYSIIGNKENQLLADANKLTQQYTETFAKNGENLFVPTVRCFEGFADFLAKFNDGVLDLKILKRISGSRKKSVDSTRRKRSEDSSISSSSRPNVLSRLDKQTALQTSSPSSFQQQQDDEEEIEEGDPRYKVDLPSVEVENEDEFEGSDNSSSDGIGVGIGLVSQLPSEETSTTFKEDSFLKRESLSLESIKMKKPSAASSSGSKFTQYPDSTWPTLGQLSAPNAPACTDIIMDFIYEMGALAGDMKLMVRAANLLDLSQKFELEKKELSQLADSLGANPNTTAPVKSQVPPPKSKSIFGKLEIGQGSGVRYEKRGSISSILSNAESTNSTDLISGTQSRFPLSSSQLSSNSIERVNTFDSSRSLPGTGGGGGLLKSDPSASKPESLDDLVVTPMLTSDSVNSGDSRNKTKLGGFLKRK